MWADTVFQAEQAHLVRLLAWAAASIVAGTALYAIIVARRGGSPLLRAFAQQMLAWGAVEALVAALSWRGLALLDLAGAARLDRMLWLQMGLEIGVTAAGATLAISGWVMSRRLGVVGAGIGVVVQALALLVLDLQLVALVSR